MSSKNTRNQAGGGGSDWSTFPATQGVEMSNNNLSNVGGINGSTTATSGYVLTVSTNKSLVWADGTAAAWSTFPATQNVNIAGYSLSNVSNVSLQKINGASYPQTLGTAGQVLTISSATNTLYWETGGGGGNIGNWATCNAIQNVNISGYSISNVLNVSTATLNASVDVYIQGVSVSGSINSLSGTVSNLSGYVYSISGAQNWSKFPAIQNVNISEYSISNISSASILNKLTVSGLTIVGDNISGIKQFNSVDVNFNLSDRIIAIGEQSTGFTGSNINAFGDHAASNVSGNGINAFGVDAAANSVGDYINAFGENAGQNSIASFGGINAFGNSAGYSNTGSHLNAFGRDSGRSNSGNYVNAIGSEAGKFNQGAFTNFIGYQVGQNNTGINTTAIGYRAGLSNTGENCIFLGTNINNLINASANQFIVYSANGSTNFLQGDMSFNRLGINCNSPQYNLDVSGSINAKTINISGVAIPSIPAANPDTLSGARYVLTASDQTTLTWRRPPMATTGTNDPTAGVTPNFGISGDVYFKRGAVIGGVSGSLVTLFFA